MSSYLTSNHIARKSGQHCHPYPQILFGWQGRMSLAFEHTGGYLGPGIFSIIPNDVEHVFQGLAKDCELIVMDFASNNDVTSDFLHSKDACAPALCGTQATFFHVPRRINELLKYYYTYHNRNDACADRMFSKKLSELIAFEISVEQLRPVAKNGLEHASGRQTRIINQKVIEAYIDDRLAEPISNSELAACAHLSESHFYVQFKRQFLMTPQNFVLKQRLLKARHLLENTEQSILMIAHEVGFADASSLTRAFRRIFGITPLQARRLS